MPTLKLSWSELNNSWNPCLSFATKVFSEQKSFLANQRFKGLFVAYLYSRSLDLNIVARDFL